jgi:hypothetical protein
VDPLVDAYAAARQLRVKPSTIRSWATRGDITRRGRDARGRTLYSWAELCAAAGVSVRRSGEHRRAG